MKSEEINKIGNVSFESILEMAILFKALADSTRLKIMFLIKDEEKNVNYISNAIGMTKSAVSHQLATLKDLRLVKSRKNGKEVYYSLDDDHINKLLKIAKDHVNE